MLYIYKTNTIIGSSISLSSSSSSSSLLINGSSISLLNEKMVNNNRNSSVNNNNNNNGNILNRIIYNNGIIISSIKNIIEKLFPSIVFALPKKRTSHKVKRIRNGFKQLKNIKYFQTCNKCQGRHLLHHLCPWCFPFNKFLAKKGDLKPKNLA